MIKYLALLDQVDAGATVSSRRESFVTLNKRFAAASKNEDAGLKLLKSTSGSSRR